MQTNKLISVGQFCLTFIDDAQCLSNAKFALEIFFSVLVLDLIQKATFDTNNTDIRKADEKTVQG